jgi:protein involved in polysaccharide export with SLBB domain
MKKIILTVLLIVSTATYSQELDQELDAAYLESLPESIKGDVLEKISEKELKDTPAYRRPSSMINKPLKESDRFGSKIFDMMQTSFMPINEPNFDSSYVLDHGDVLELQLIGNKNSIDEFSIKRDGSINIQEIGKLFVAGLSLDTASSLIQNKISDAYIGTEVLVSLVNIRDIQILISGHAFNPGIYTLNGNSNLLHALSMAGGIDEMGSYRQVDLIRDNDVIETLDLYDIFIHGRSGFGQRLRSGDSILIRPVNEIISISGAVKRPASYEIISGETFLDVFNFANGFTDSANKDTLRIERMDKDAILFIDVPDVNSLSSIKIAPGDRLNVRSFKRKTVTISGAVKRPGKYVISRGDTLSSLIEFADGYDEDAYPFGGILNNNRTEEINIEAVEKLYTSYIQELITKGSPLFASESLPFILEELKNTNVSGRVIAEFDLDVIKASPGIDTTLEDGDDIFIPIKTEQVYIFGEVNNPGTIRYIPKGSVHDYLNKSGSILDGADKKNIFVIHPNGEINSLKANSLSIRNNRASDILIYPGSVIYVPKKVTKRDPSLVASIWAPILSSLAVTATSLSILDKN